MLQIGLLTIATYFVELLLERGFVIAVGSLLYQFLQGEARTRRGEVRTTVCHVEKPTQNLKSCACKGLQVALKVDIPVVAAARTALLHVLCTAPTQLSCRPDLAS